MGKGAPSGLFFISSYPAGLDLRGAQSPALLKTPKGIAGQLLTVNGDLDGVGGAGAEVASWPPSRICRRQRKWNPPGSLVAKSLSSYS